MQCASCELVSTDPQLSENELQPYYAQEYWGRTNADSQELVRRDQRHRTRFLYRFCRQGRVLDVGCGWGAFLLALDPASWDRYGLEATPVAYEQASKRLGIERIVRGELGSVVLPVSNFDVITFWDVLEHLPDPRRTLEQACCRLAPGGLLLLTLPNFGSYQARHFGEDWYALSLPRHLYHFTPASLNRLLQLTGFRLRTLERRAGHENYRALRHSVLARMIRRYGADPGRLRYHLLKPFLHPWEWISTRLGGSSSLQVCTERSEKES